MYDYLINHTNTNMSYKLSDKTKETISRRVGIPCEQLSEMSDEEIKSYIEQKTGKKITWPKGAKVDDLGIRTMEDVEKNIGELYGSKNQKGWDR